MIVSVKKLKLNNGSNVISNSNMEETFVLLDEYLVYGLTFTPNSNYAQIYHNNNLISVPMSLFEIIDDRVSKYWVIKQNEEGTIFLWPEEFFKEYFHDDLSEGVSEIVRTFKNVQEKMNLESTEEDK
ncbi:MAG: hypothetical protein AAF489_08765 [Bacteroidota bacterium]